MTAAPLTPSWHAEHTPEAPAIVMGATGETVSYAQLEDRSARLARALRARGEWWGPIIHEYYAETEEIGNTAITSAEWLAHPGSVGRPAVECHIIGADGRELAAGEAGLVYFAGGRPFTYHNDAGKTEAITNANGKCPRSVEPNGKLYKRRLRERYWAGHTSLIV